MIATGTHSAHHAVTIGVYSLALGDGIGKTILPSLLGGAENSLPTIAKDVVVLYVPNAQIWLSPIINWYIILYCPIRGQQTSNNRNKKRETVGVLK